MIRTGFKVCSIGHKGFQSAFSFATVVKYQINNWSYQPKGCGPLAVFRTLCGVDDFITHNESLGRGNSQTFLCEYEESDEKVLYDKNGREFDMLPRGTELATKVKLIKKM